MKTIEKENGQALVLRDRLNTLRRRCEKINKEIEEKTAEFHRVCIHPPDKVEVKDSYVDGSYYDKCQYIKKYYCTVCGKLIDEQVTYGGYG